MRRRAFAEVFGSRVPGYGANMTSLNPTQLPNARSPWTIGGLEAVSRSPPMPFSYIPQPFNTSHAVPDFKGQILDKFSAEKMSKLMTSTEHNETKSVESQSERSATLNRFLPQLYLPSPSIGHWLADPQAMQHYPFAHAMAKLPSSPFLTGIEGAAREPAFHPWNLQSMMAASRNAQILDKLTASSRSQRNDDERMARRSSESQPIDFNCAKTNGQSTTVNKRPSSSSASEDEYVQETKRRRSNSPPPVQIDSGIPQPPLTRSPVEQLSPSSAYGSAFHASMQQAMLGFNAQLLHSGKSHPYADLHSLYASTLFNQQYRGSHLLSAVNNS